MLACPHVLFIGVSYLDLPQRRTKRDELRRFLEYIVEMLLSATIRP